MKIEFEEGEKTILWVVGGVAALLAVYGVLKATGLWDQWFGSAQIPQPQPIQMPPPQQTQQQPDAAGYPQPYVQ